MGRNGDPVKGRSMKDELRKKEMLDVYEAQRFACFPPDSQIANRKSQMRFARIARLPVLLPYKRDESITNLFCVIDVTIEFLL